MAKRDYPDSAFMRCRFCTYKVLRYRRQKNGRVRHGEQRLLNHVIEVHRDVYQPILLREYADSCSDPATMDNTCLYCHHQGCEGDCMRSHAVQDAQAVDCLHQMGV